MVCCQVDAGPRHSERTILKRLIGVRGDAVRGEFWLVVGNRSLG